MKLPWYFRQDQQTHLTTDLKQAQALDFGIERLKVIMLFYAFLRNLCCLKNVNLLSQKAFQEIDKTALQKQRFLIKEYTYSYSLPRNATVLIL